MSFYDTYASTPCLRKKICANVSAVVTRSRIRAIVPLPGLSKNCQKIFLSKNSLPQIAKFWPKTVTFKRKGNLQAKLKF